MSPVDDIGKVVIILKNLFTQIYGSDFDMSVKVSAFLILLGVLFMVISPFILLYNFGRTIVVILFNVIINPLIKICKWLVGLFVGNRNCKVVCKK